MLPTDFQRQVTPGPYCFEHPQLLAHKNAQTGKTRKSYGLFCLQIPKHPVTYTLVFIRSALHWMSWAFLNFSPNFNLSWSYPFSINFRWHSLCGLLVLTGGTPARPAWMRRNELVMFCRCHKAQCNLGSCGMLVIHQIWKLAVARRRWGELRKTVSGSLKTYPWCSY